MLGLSTAVLGKPHNLQDSAKVLSEHSQAHPRSLGYLSHTLGDPWEWPSLPTASAGAS